MKRLWVMLIFVLLLFASCTIMNDHVVAVVGGQKITDDELYRYIPEANFKALSPEDKKAKVDQICYDFLTKRFLEDRGDFDSTDVVWEIRSWDVRELANQAYRDLVINKILTTEAMHDLYNKMKYELSVSHLVIGYNNEKHLNGRTREQAVALVDSLSGVITKNNFDSLVMKYSDDGSKVKNGGHLNWARTGHWVEPFEDAAFKLEPGEISGPVETPYGFHIIQLNERRELPLDPYESMKGELTEMAYNRWRPKFIQRDHEVFDSLRTTNPLVLNDSLVADFVDRFVRLSKNVFYSDQFTAFDIMDIFPDSLYVGYIGDDPIDKDWIYQYLKMISLVVPPRFTDVDSFTRFVRQNASGALLFKAAHNLGLDKTKEYLNDRSVYLAKKSGDLFDKRYVFDQINPGQDSLKAFYEKHKADLYNNEARVRVREVLVADSTLAQTIYQRALSGESMADLATQYSIRNIGKKNKGLIPPVKKNQYDKMSLAAFNMLDGEIAGPFKLGDNYSVIQRVEYIPETYRDYNEISYRILTDYRNYYMEAKRNKQRAMLEKTYPIRINKSFTE